MYSYRKSLFTYCITFAPATETVIIQKSNTRFQIQCKNKLSSYFCKTLALWSSVVVQLPSCVRLCATSWTAACQATILHYLLELAQTHVYWVSDAIQPSHSLSPPSPSALSFPASGSFLMSQFFASGGQSIGVLASASVLPMNIQHWFPLGLTGLISLQFKGPSRVFSSTTVQKHQFFCTQPSLWSTSHIHTGLLKKP